METTNPFLQTALLDLGLNPTEAAAYQVALAAGPRTASTIARMAGINRSHAYQVLSLLAEKGLVEEVTKNRVKHFSPRPPEVVIDKLQMLADRIAGSRHQLKTALPDITRFQPHNGFADPVVQFVRGRSGIEQAWNEILREENIEIQTFIDPDSIMFLMDPESKRWRKSFFKLLKPSHVHIKAIAPLELVDFNDSKFELRLLSDVQFGGDVLISACRVTILHYSPQQAGLYFTSNPAASCLKQIHQLAWPMATQSVSPK